MNLRDSDKENKYLRAKDRVAEIKKFYTSLFFYVIFMGFLAGLNYYTNEWRYMWFLWAALGWGIGLVFQAAKAFDGKKTNAKSCGRYHQFSKSGSPGR